jgi:hypothetical protein
MYLDLLYILYTNTVIFLGIFWFIAEKVAIDHVNEFTLFPSIENM